VLNVGIFLVMTGRQAGGPETYERCLVDSLSRLNHDMAFHTLSLERTARPLLPPEGPQMQHHLLRPSMRVVSTALSLPLALMRLRIDLLHAPFTPPPFSTRPYVFTHHCFSTFNHPEFYAPGILMRLNALLKRGLRSARRIICVSQCTLDLTAEYLKLDRQRMHVVHNGVAPQYRLQDKAAARTLMAERYGLRKPFFLYVGKLESRKNIVRILHAFNRFRHEARDQVQLVLAGRRTPMSEGIDDAMHSLKLKDDVVEIGYVPDEDMPALYSAAHAFVFPTLWEGFGIPVIEAMACGTPVITSNLSSLPEVSGDAALLVDPYRVDDIAQAMLTLWLDADVRKTMAARGVVNARRFSWDETARQTLEVYRATALD
jgi:glycosyltransferase involved in cell wall biosynthesis